MVTLLRRTPTERERWADEVLDRLSPVMTALGVLFLLVVLGESVAREGTSVAVALTVLGWGLWLVFVVEFVARLVVAPDTGRFLRRNWWQLLFLVLPFLRVLRVVRAARFLRTGRVLSSAVRSSRSAHQVLGGRIGWLGVVWAITVMGSSQLLFQFSEFRRPIAVIDHPPGAETQWDWVELPDPPSSWGWGANAHLLVGALSHSGAWRGVLCESEDQPHLIDGLDRIARALGGLTRDWRFDRMATVISPGTGKVSASFAGVAKHYGVVVRPCPPRRGNRKGVVEKANHVAAQRFWRTLPDDVSIEEAQARLDTWCARRADARVRSTGAGKTTVAALAAAEPLGPVPAPFPATLTVTRTVSAQGLVSFRGNRYSVPPELASARVSVVLRLGSPTIDIATTPGPTVGARGGIVMARHRLASTGAGAMIRDDGHVIALEQAAMAAATPAGPHRGKVRRPPSLAALDAAAALRAATGTEATTARPAAVVIDLSVYAAAAAGRNTLPSR